MDFERGLKQWNVKGDLMFVIISKNELVLDSQN